MTDEASNQFAIAQKLQSQFRFYVASLVFTLLALSVQTAEFGTSKVHDSAEIIGWILLLLCGLASLWYIEMEATVREQGGLEAEYSQKLLDAKKARFEGAKNIRNVSSGNVQSVDDRISKISASHTKILAIFNRLNDQNSKRYVFARSTFVAGLITLIFSRSAEAVAGIFGYQLL